MHTSLKSKYALLLIFLLLALTGIGQSEWKNWDGLNFNLGVAKKTDLQLNHLRSYDISQSFENSFNQWSIGLDYDFTKKISGKIGFRQTRFPAGNVSTNRFLARVTYRIRLGEAINWSNGIQGEIHSANQNLYNHRIIFMTRVAARRRLDFLRLSPSVSYWLYYNAGGSAIQYYDEAGSPLVKETPDGIHRGRFTLKLNSKINNYFSLSLYYMNQHEFNLAGNNINVTDPDTGKIARPFNNFQVVGLSLSFSYDLYKKKKSKQHRPNDNSENN
jgi:hypothetical protein